MSLSRFFAPEFRPLLRSFDEPFGLFNQPFFDDRVFRAAGGISPAVDVTENENGYVVHAELPGVKKENVKVNLGDAGRSLSISGRVVIREGGSANANNDASTSATPADTNTNNAKEASSQEVTKQDDGHKLYNERTFVQDSSFSRTIQLPYPVDPSKVTAKMDNGVLTINLYKMEDKATTKTITID